MGSLRHYDSASARGVKKELFGGEKPIPLSTGREWDKETGLYYYRARYYDPVEGRFISKDPIGFTGGINHYAYTDNNPINFTDPSGLNPYFDALESLALRAAPYIPKAAEFVTEWAKGQVAIPGGLGKLDAAKFVWDKAKNLFPDSPPQKYQIPPIPPGWTVDPATGLLIPPKETVCESRR